MPIIKAVKKLRKPIKMSVEERTSGLLKEGRDYKTGSEGEYISLKDKEPKKLRKPIKMSVEERTSGLLKEGEDYKTGSKGEYISLKNKEYNKNPIAERKKLTEKINNKTATKDEIKAMDMIEEMDVGMAKGGLVKKGLPKLAKRGWK